MVNLMTLKGLESIAEKEFEGQADEWAEAIARREGIGFHDLRPYLVSLCYEPGWFLEVVFVIPEHTPIKLWANHYAFEDKERQVVPKIEDGKVIGDYCWMAFREHSTGSPSFTGVKSLGHALLLSRWANDGNMKAEYF